MPWDLQAWLWNCLKHEDLVRLLDLKSDEPKQRKVTRARGIAHFQGKGGLREMSWQSNEMKGNKGWRRGGVPLILAFTELSHASDLCMCPNSCRKHPGTPRFKGWKLSTGIKSGDLRFWLLTEMWDANSDVKILNPCFQGKAIQVPSRSLCSPSAEALS